jgi:hypothetical protein
LGCRGAVLSPVAFLCPGVPFDSPRPRLPLLLPLLPPLPRRPALPPALLRPTALPRPPDLPRPAAMLPCSSDSGMIAFTLGYACGYAAVGEAAARSTAQTHRPAAWRSPFRTQWSQSAVWRLLPFPPHAFALTVGRS